MFDTLPDDTGPGPGEPSHDRAPQPGRRHLSDRQAEAVERLVDAAAAEVAERSYAEVSVRSIAKRAGVAAATAYTYFSSKDHILAEVLWRRMQAAPHLVDLTQPLPERVANAVRTMGFGAENSPAVVAACATALLGDGPDVMDVRARIGREVGKRLQAALGPDVDPAVHRVLQITYTGAILSAGLAHLRFADLPGLLAEAAELLTGGAR
jgi:AcrR family transcriptional regulator